MSHIHLVTDKNTKPKPFKIHYWRECYISPDKIELRFGMTECSIFTDGVVTFSGGTMPVTNMYHLINEAMAIYIHYFGKHGNDNTRQHSS